MSDLELTDAVGSAWEAGDSAVTRPPRLRRTLIAQALAGMVGLNLSLPVLALGIGEPHQISHLFEPLRVDIPIEVGVSDSELRVHLLLRSGADTTSQPGLRQELLTDANGQHILRVSTREPVREPILTLHVDLADHDLQLRRDLTLLFDPPASDAPAAVLVADAPRVPEPPVIEARASVRPVKPVEVTSVSPSQPAVGIPAGWRISLPVREGETLEQIARRLRPSVDTPVETMAAVLRRHNPLAFEPDSGNLKVGTQLRCPGKDMIQSELAAVSSSETGQELAAAAQPPRQTDRPTVKSAIRTSAVGSGWRLSRPVAPRETLEQIAERLRPSDDTSVAAMAALLRWNNPRAFEARSGRLRTGVQLRFPAGAAMDGELAAFTAPEPVPAPVIVATTGPVSQAPEQAGLSLSTALSADSLRLVLAASPPVPATESTLVAASSALLPTAEAAAPLPSLSTRLALVPPAPTLFPAWLLAAAMMLGGFMLWALMRLLRNTPPPMPKLAYREPVRLPATRPESVPGPLPLPQAQAEAQPLRPAPGVPGIELSWDLENFDLSRDIPAGGSVPRPGVDTSGSR